MSIYNDLEVESQENFIFYVYAYLNNDGSPYYIGKGKNNRAYQIHGKISVPEDKSQIIFLEKNLSEIGALALERRYIEWYRNIDFNILMNKRSGGQTGNPKSRMVKYRVKNPNGNVFTIENLNAFCKKRKLHQRAMSAVARLEISHYKLWQVRLEIDKTPFLDLYRYTFKSPEGDIIHVANVSEFLKKYPIFAESTINDLICRKQKHFCFWQCRKFGSKQKFLTIDQLKKLDIKYVVKLVDAFGNYYLVAKVARFAKKFNMHRKSLIELIRGNIKHAGKQKFRLMDFGSNVQELLNLKFH